MLFLTAILLGIALKYNTNDNNSNKTIKETLKILTSLRIVLATAVFHRSPNYQRFREAFVLFLSQLQVRDHLRFA